jgi:hypothetical protein
MHFMGKYRPHSGNRLRKPDSFDPRRPLFTNTSISFSPERKKSRKLTRMAKIFELAFLLEVTPFNHPHFGLSSSPLSWILTGNMELNVAGER